jgi:hypothetical protein
VDLENTTYDENFIDRDVTLSNFTNLEQQQTRFNKAVKAITDALEGKRALPFEAIKSAILASYTDAINSAQTEVIFENGFILRNKEYPNLLVRLTAGGIGISSDGGQSYTTAITGEGIVADAITTGTLNATLVRIVGGNGYIVMDGDSFKSVDPNNDSKYVEIVPGQINIEGGGINIKRPDGYVWVEDGIAKFDFNVQTTNPSFTHVDVEARNSWFRTQSTNYVSCDRYRFAHKNRYFMIDLSQYVNSGGVCSVAIVDTKTGEILAERTSTNDELYSEEGTFGGTIIIDLGVPSNDETERRDFYFQMKTSDATREARCRFNGVWLEG